MAMQARDRGTVATFDFQLTAPIASLPSTTKPLSLTMKTAGTDGVGGVRLSPQGSYPTLGLGGLCGAFTDKNGAVIEAIAIGASPKTFVVPAGATQLQLGVDDDFFKDENGPGYVVNLNGVTVTVPPTSMPCNWVAGGLNTNFQYGIKDGTSPVVALTGFVAGPGLATWRMSRPTATAAYWNPILRSIMSRGLDW
jgi:hypothetical protein